MGRKEDTALIIEVLEREHILFDEIKGSGVKSIQRKRQDSWQDVTDILNSYQLLYKLYIYLSYIYNGEIKMYFIYVYTLYIYIYIYIYIW